MSRVRIAAALALWSVGAISHAAAPPATESPPSIEAQVDKFFDALDSTHSPGCSLAVIRNGEIVYERGYGMADLEHNVAITPQSILYAASVSKQFTGAAIALLEQQGKLAADDDVRKYVPELPRYRQTVRLHHLIHHTSGIPDYLELWSNSGHSFMESLSHAEALALIAAQKKLQFQPGEKFSYSNSGYFLLSLIVERASGQTLRQFAEVNLFKPLGMTHTQFYDDATQLVPNRAFGYERREDGSLSRVHTTFALVGDGGLLTSVQDLAVWDRHFDKNPDAAGGATLVTKQLSRRSLNSGAENNYAYGLSVGKYRGLPTVEHSGSFIGFNSKYLRFPEQHFSVAALCNLDGSQPGRMVAQIADLYLAEAFTEPK